MSEVLAKQSRDDPNTVAIEVAREREAAVITFLDLQTFGEALLANQYTGEEMIARLIQIARHGKDADSKGAIALLRAIRNDGLVQSGHLTLLRGKEKKVEVDGSTTEREFVVKQLSSNLKENLANVRREESRDRELASEEAAVDAVWKPSDTGGSTPAPARLDEGVTGGSSAGSDPVPGQPTGSVGDANAEPVGGERRSGDSGPGPDTIRPSGS